MRGCVSFQINVQILAFYTDVCTAPKQAVSYVVDEEGLSYFS